jgi:N-acetylmuramoyl-L-alanine amidase
MGYFPDGAMNEYRFHSEVIAPLIFQYGNDTELQTKIFTRDKIGVAGAYKNINDWGKDKNVAVCELHFNAFNAQASGTETLFDMKPASSEVLARIIQNKLCQAFRRPAQSRGVKLTNEGRGAYNLQLCKLPGVLTEAFFGDNKVDAALGYNLRHEYAKAIVNGAKEFLAQNKIK